MTKIFFAEKFVNHIKILVKGFERDWDMTQEFEWLESSQTADVI